MTSSADPGGWLSAIASASPTATIRSPSRTTAPPKMIDSASSMVTTSLPAMMILSGISVSSEDADLLRRADHPGAAVPACGYCWGSRSFV